jgi:hypothetical protein
LRWPSPLPSPARRGGKSLSVRRMGLDIPDSTLVPLG